MTRRPPLRTLAAAALWIAIGAGAFQIFYLRIYTFDLDSLGASVAGAPYRSAPGLRALLVEADRRVPPGARVAVWTPHRTFAGGYSYVFNRAQFVLTGREVLPILDPHDRPVPGSLETADSIACWPRCSAPPGFSLVWQSDNASLWRRGR